MGGYLRIEDIKKHNRVLKKNVEKLEDFLENKSGTAIIEHSLTKPKKQKRIKKKVEKIVLTVDDIKEVEIKINSIRNKSIQEHKFIKDHFKETKNEINIKNYLNEYNKLESLKKIIQKGKKPFKIYKLKNFYKIFKKDLIRRDKELVHKHKKDLIIISTKNKLK